MYCTINYKVLVSSASLVAWVLDAGCYCEGKRDRDRETGRGELCPCGWADS